MKPESKHFKLNVPPDLLENLKVLAASESRSMTSQINLMLRRQLTAEKCEASTCASSICQHNAYKSMENNRWMICSCARQTLRELVGGNDDG